MKKIIVFIVAFAVSVNAFSARSWENVKVKQILAHDNGSSNYPGLINVYMHTEMESSTVPSCVTNAAYKSNFAIDLSRPGAEAQYSLLLASYMAGKTVTISVNNSCIEGIPLIRNVYTGE